MRLNNDRHNLMEGRQLRLLFIFHWAGTPMSSGSTFYFYWHVLKLEITWKSSSRLEYFQTFSMPENPKTREKTHYITKWFEFQSDHDTVIYFYM